MKPIEPIYKPAVELGITEQERAELIESIPYFLDLAPSEFDMLNWRYCACGHIARRNGREWEDEYNRCSYPLRSIYTTTGKVWSKIGIPFAAVSKIKPADAARAIVAFLSGVHVA